MLTVDGDELDVVVDDVLVWEVVDGSVIRAPVFFVLVVWSKLEKVQDDRPVKRFFSFGEA